MATEIKPLTVIVMDDCPECGGAGERAVPGWQAEITGEGTVTCDKCRGRGTWPVSIPRPDDWEDDPRD